MGPTVDVAISAYGKPYQTAVTLASLLRHSAQHIGTIWFQEELEQPFGARVDSLPGLFPTQDFKAFRPARHLGYGLVRPEEFQIDETRLSIRYQRAWEQTDKDFLFITHNDCLYSSDIVGGMLERLYDGLFSGVGIIGQCWNCPARSADVCDGNRYETYRPTYDEVSALLALYPSPRTRLEMIDRIQPAPLPECRLNEFGCMINLRKCRAETLPHGDAPPFGHLGLDTGTEWFHLLSRRGHRFLNWFEGLRHAPFTGEGGNLSTSSAELYEDAETKARNYLFEYYPEVAAKMELH